VGGWGGDNAPVHMQNKAKTIIHENQAKAGEEVERESLGAVWWIKKKGTTRGVGRFPARRTFEKKKKGLVRRKEKRRSGKFIEEEKKKGK